jgi:exodeoxyribonuclease VII small subunit
LAAPLGRIEAARYNDGMTKKNTTDAKAISLETPAPASYEAGIERLEVLVRKLESGALTLEESLAAYQEGAGLVEHCRRALDHVEEQVKILENGLLKNFDEQPDSDDQAS